MFLLFSLGYLFHLDVFSQELLKERANGKTNIDLFLNNSTDLTVYFLLALLMIMIAAFIVWRMIKEVRYSDKIKEFINAGGLILLLVILIIIVIKMITIPIMQILLSAFAFVLGGITLTHGNK